MPNHESPNGPPEQRDAAREGATPDPDAPGEAVQEASPSSTQQPRDLAQRVWGSWPSLPTGAAPPAAPQAPPSAPAQAPPEPDVADLDVDDEALDDDVLRLEDRLRDTEDRLESFSESMQRSLRSLADTIHASTADLPAAIEAVVERRLNAVGDALLKLADLRAKLQEETGEAVRGLHASFQTLEERLVEGTQQRVEASMDRLAAEVRELRDEIAQFGSAPGGAAAVEGIEQRLHDRVAELPTRGDFASIRGAIGTVASSLRTELAEVAQRIDRIDAALSSRAPASDEGRSADQGPETGPPQDAAAEEGSVEDPFGEGPLFDFPER